MKRIGLIGGLSWKSTSVYYSMLNTTFSFGAESWAQPEVIIDSLNFGAIVEFQAEQKWDETARLLIDSARRLEAAGATVLAISANTMHINYDEVSAAVQVPVLDIRDSVVNEVSAMGENCVVVLGTKYLLRAEFYSTFLENRGLRVIKPNEQQTIELQEMIYGELTRGVVSETSRDRLLGIVKEMRSRGDGVVALCCTELGLLIDPARAPWPCVDSAAAHVRSLLAF